MTARTAGTVLLLSGRASSYTSVIPAQGVPEPRAGYNHLDVVGEEDEPCGSSLSLFMFAVLGEMRSSRDTLNQQHVFPGMFLFLKMPQSFFKINGTIYN